MGAIQQAVNQTIGTAAVGAHAAKRGLGISAANDGKKNKEMKKKADDNVKDVLAAKMEQARVIHTVFNENDPRAKADFKDLMGDR